MIARNACWALAAAMLLASTLAYAQSPESAGPEGQAVQSPAAPEPAAPPPSPRRGATPIISDKESVAQTPWVVTNPDWRRKPTGEELERYYPARAQREEIDGSATISCEVAASGHLEACVVEAEAPAGYGFGAAALKLSPSFEMKPKTADGMPVAGGKVRIPLIFRMPEPAPQPRVPPLLLLATLASLIVCAVVAGLIDQRRRDRGLRVDDLLGEAFSFIGRLWRRAPLSMLTLAATAFAVGWAREGPWAIPAYLTFLIAEAFVYAAAFRLALRPKGDAMTLGRAWGLVAASGFITVVLMIAIVAVSLALAFGLHLVLPALSAPPLAEPLALGGLIGLGVVVLFVVLMRLSLVGAASVAQGRFSLGGGWTAGRGRLGALLIGRILAGFGSVLLQGAALIIARAYGAPFSLAAGAALALTVATFVPMQLGVATFLAGRR